MQRDKPCAGESAHFPFTALEGQAELQRALLLCALEPMIGGLLIEGPRGTAKSTSARALAALLPAGRFVNLPLAASAEQVVGSLDIDAALKGGGVQFRPGLLARAHGGVLYVDEVNLLADHLVDLLLDVSASGVNIVERDGISHAHPARIVLIGTMNPEEGELRPQLLDRFGLFLRLADAPDLATRQRIVSARLAFDADPAAFIARRAADEAALRERLAGARARLRQIDYAGADIARVGELCRAARVEGVRADLALLRAARANAALEGRAQIDAQDIDRVAPWVLAHRGASAVPRSGAGATETESTPADRPSPASADRGADSADHGLEAQAASSGQTPSAQAANTAAATGAPEPGEAGAHSAPTRREDPAASPDTAAPADPARADWGALRAPRSPAPAPLKGLRPLPLPPKKF